MKTNLKHVALTLGLLIIMVMPAVAQSTSYDPLGGNTPPNSYRTMIAGNSSLVVTDNRSPAPQNDPQSPGPELILTEPMFDFDRVLEGEEVVHDLLIENGGAGTLAIHQVRTG